MVQFILNLFSFYQDPLKFLKRSTYCRNITEPSLDLVKRFTGSLDLYPKKKLTMMTKNSFEYIFWHMPGTNTVLHKTLHYLFHTLIIVSFHWVSACVTLELWLSSLRCSTAQYLCRFPIDLSGVTWQHSIEQLCLNSASLPAKFISSSWRTYLNQC